MIAVPVVQWPLAAAAAGLAAAGVAVVAAVAVSRAARAWTRHEGAPAAGEAGWALRFGPALGAAAGLAAVAGCGSAGHGRPASPPAPA